VETTRVLDETGYAVYGNESEPIRFTTLSLASGDIWDQLIHPSQSQAVSGSEYHGLAMTDLEGKPTISEVWPQFAERLEDCHVVIFGLDWARQAVRSVYPTHMLDSVFCLHNKAKEFYGEFYELSLEKILTYQGIEKKRDELTDSRVRILMLDQVIRNLAAGMTKAVQESEGSDGLDDDHPF
jgi:DNA polymerase III epsilon subunit-like protein